VLVVVRAGSPGPRRRAPDERVEQLLDAAERVLLERGLAATTVADVADAAGLAKGTLYLYFESKDALLAGLRARYLSRFSEALGASRARTAPGATGRLDRFVTGLFEFSAQHARLHHLLFHEAGFSEDDALAGARAMLAEIITAGCESGEFDATDPPRSASFLLHGLHGLLLDALHDGSNVNRAATAAREMARRSVAS
jgi:AcrR family transcriptional regulator